MFIGHFALAYASKRWAPRLSLAVLFAAAMFADLLWPVLVAMGIEQVRIAPGFTASTPLEFINYPYSHSLLTLALFGAIFGAVASTFVRRSTVVAPAAVPRARVAGIILALVVSHWVLDLVTHTPDLPLYPGGPKFGLGLWNSVPGTLVAEVTLFAAGVWMYAASTIPIDSSGKWGFIGITAFLFVGFVVNANGTPPPSVTALWIMALALGALTLCLAWFADSHRRSRT